MRGAATAESRKTAVILGLPNTGKSSLFGRLTGVYSLVANYPHTTVEEKRAACRIGGQLYDVVDTPGLHCLYIHSEEELAVRELLYRERPDIVIQCIDASCLKQSLALTADLLDLGVPLVVCLNAMDEATKRGLRIARRRLEEKLGVPVVETVAKDGRGVRRLRQVLPRARPGARLGRYGEAFEAGVSAIAGALDGTMPYTWKTSVLLLLDDPFMRGQVERRASTDQLGLLDERIESARRELKGRVTQGLLDFRRRWVEEVAKDVVERSAPREWSFAERFSHMSRHPIYGIPIFLFFIALTFFMVVGVAGSLEKVLERFVVLPVVGFVSGVLPSGFWADFLVGHYGVLTLGLLNALCTVLPILGVFFLVLGFLEDIGYIPNLCVLMRNLFGRLGLTGNSALSLVLAFGCRTMATLTTRGIASFKEKFIANCLIAFTIPCGAQLALQIGVLGRIGALAFALTFGTMMVCLLAVGMFLNKILKDDSVGDFLQELPPARFPNVRELLAKTGYRLGWFLKEALPIFLLAAVVLFALDATGALGRIKAFFQPVAVGWLGLPRDIMDVLLLCLARHEAAAGLLLNMVDSNLLDPVQAVVSVVLITMFIPCMAHIGALRREMGTRTAALTILCTMSCALVVSGLLHRTLALFLGGPK